MEELSTIFNTLSNPIRLEIYERILSEACSCDLDNKKGISGNCVSELAKDLDLNQPTVSNHIKELIAAGLVNVRKVGTRSYLFGTKKSVSKINEFATHARNEVARSKNSF